MVRDQVNVKVYRERWPTSLYPLTLGIVRADAKMSRARNCGTTHVS